MSLATVASESNKMPYGSRFDVLFSSQENRGDVQLVNDDFEIKPFVFELERLCFGTIGKAFFSFDDDDGC